MAQQSQNEMDMRISRSRDRRASFTNISDSNHSTYSVTDSSGGRGAPPTDRSGRSISYDTPYDAVHHLELQHNQHQHQQMMTAPSGESVFGSGSGGSIHSGSSPRPGFPHHASMYYSAAHHHHATTSLSGMSVRSGGGGGGARRRHSSYDTYAVGSHDHHHNYASSPARFSALAASAAADDSADAIAAEVAAASMTSASTFTRGFHTGGGVGFVRGLVYEEVEGVQTSGRGVVNGDDSDDDAGLPRDDNDVDELADGIFTIELN